MKQNIIKIILIFIGSISIGVGIIGTFLPLLPTTPFLLLGATCYVNSSDKFYNWLISNRWLGKYIQNYREKKAITKKAKLMSLTVLWVTMGYSVIFVISFITIKIMLMLLALGVSYHILSLNTLDDV